MCFSGEESNEELLRKLLQMQDKNRRLRSTVVTMKEELERHKQAEREIREAILQKEQNVADASGSAREVEELSAKLKEITIHHQMMLKMVDEAEASLQEYDVEEEGIGRAIQAKDVDDTPADEAPADSPLTPAEEEAPEPEEQPELEPEATKTFSPTDLPVSDVQTLAMTELESTSRTEDARVETAPQTPLPEPSQRISLTRDEVETPFEEEPEPLEVVEEFALPTTATRTDRADVTERMRHEVPLSDEANEMVAMEHSRTNQVPIHEVPAVSLKDEVVSNALEDVAICNSALEPMRLTADLHDAESEYNEAMEQVDRKRDAPLVIREARLRPTDLTSRAEEESSQHAMEDVSLRQLTDPHHTLPQSTTLRETNPHMPGYARTYLEEERELSDSDDEDTKVVTALEWFAPRAQHSQAKPPKAEPKKEEEPRMERNSPARSHASIEALSAPGETVALTGGAELENSTPGIELDQRWTVKRRSREPQEEPPQPSDEPEYLPHRKADPDTVPSDEDDARSYSLSREIVSLTGGHEQEEETNAVEDDQHGEGGLLAPTEKEPHPESEVLPVEEPEPEPEVEEQPEPEVLPVEEPEPEEEEQPEPEVLPVEEPEPEEEEQPEPEVLPVEEPEPEEEEQPEPEVLPVEEPEPEVEEQPEPEVLPVEEPEPEGEEQPEPEVLPVEEPEPEGEEQPEPEVLPVEEPEPEEEEQPEPEPEPEELPVEEPEPEVNPMEERASEEYAEMPTEAPEGEIVDDGEGGHEPIGGQGERGQPGEEPPADAENPDYALNSEPKRHGRLLTSQNGGSGGHSGGRGGGEEPSEEDHGTQEQRQLCGHPPYYDRMTIDEELRTEEDQAKVGAAVAPIPLNKENRVDVTPQSGFARISSRKSSPVRHRLPPPPGSRPQSSNYADLILASYVNDSMVPVSESIVARSRSGSQMTASPRSGSHIALPMEDQNRFEIRSSPHGDVVEQDVLEGKRYWKQENPMVVHHKMSSSMLDRYEQAESDRYRMHSNRYRDLVVKASEEVGGERGDAILNSFLEFRYGPKKPIQQRRFYQDSKINWSQVLTDQNSVLEDLELKQGRK